MAYVYTHTRLDTNQIFYVGIGSDSKGRHKRAYCKDKRSNFWNQIAAKTQISITIQADNITWEQACDIEIYLILFFGRRDLHRGPLVNLTNGGEGTRGVVLSNETRSKVSIALRGKKKSPEHIEKVRVAQIGKKISPEQIQQMRLRNIGKKASSETKNKMSLSQKGRKHSQATLNKMKGRKFTEEHLSKLRGRKLSIAHVEKIRSKRLSQESKDRMKAAWVKRKLAKKKVTHQPELW